jgi:hypothetical protein
LPPRNFNQTSSSEQENISSNSNSDVEEVHQSVIEDEEEISLVDDLNKDKYSNEKLMQHGDERMNSSFTLQAIVIAISIALLAFVAIFIIYKHYKATTNPLNYKDRHSDGTRRADEEFSEVRFLTSDEALDFTLATLDNATDL